MVAFRELYVTDVDGRSRLEARERDDAEGRRAIERAAFAALARPAMRAAYTQVVDRWTGRKGSVR